MSIQISVVIPAYNSKSLLRHGLISLEKQTASLELFEVIVVDDGSSDGTTQMLEEFKKTTPLNLQNIYIENSGPATARNKGIAASQAEWIAMLDADVLAHADWIHRILELIEHYPNVAGFEGRTLVNDRHKLTPFTHQTENFYGGRYPTCNMVVRKELCHFYTKYRIPFREDTDLAFCILESGYNIHFDSNMKVFHPPLSPSYYRPIKLAFRYYYDGLLRRRFPQRYKRNLDAHLFMGVSIPHIKKKIYGIFLLGQILFLLGLATMPPNTISMTVVTLFFLVTYFLSYWSSIRSTMPKSRTWPDLLMLGVVNTVVPWVIYTQLLKGMIHFRNEPEFDSAEWLNGITLPKPKKTHEFILISTADWDHPFWTNKQHITARLAERGHRVLYVESLGLRQFTTSIRDLKRIYRRTKRSLLWGRNLRPNIWVWSPLVIPLHSYSIVRKLNWWILSACIRYFTKTLQFKNPILWSYNPTIAPISKNINFTKHVYHCVDELREAPGMPVELLELEEHRYCEQVDMIITTSPTLYQNRKQWNPRTYYLPNPCDFEHFNQVTGDIRMASPLEEIPEPRIGFVGALSHYKVDAELIKQITKQHPDWHVVLLGQVGEGEPHARFDELLSFPNIHFLGPKPYDELPHYLKGFNVAMLPCPINGYTQSMFPLKFFEYLAAGIPVVTTALASLEGYKDICYWTHTNEEFMDAIRTVLEDKDPERIAMGIDLAQENTWENRVESILKLLEEH